MALPIEPTPCLNKEATRQFLAKVEAKLNVPAHRKPTPEMDEAREIGLKHAVLRPTRSLQ